MYNQKEGKRMEINEINELIDGKVKLFSYNLN